MRKRNRATVTKIKIFSREMNFTDILVVQFVDSQGAVKRAEIEYRDDMYLKNASKMFRKLAKKLKKESRK